MLWLVGLSTVTTDLPGAPKGLIDLLVAIAGLPWWLLLLIPAFVLGWQVWVALRVSSTLTAMQNEVTRQVELSEEFRTVVVDMRETKNRIAAVEGALAAGFSTVADAIQQQIGIAALIAPHVITIKEAEESAATLNSLIMNDPIGLDFQSYPVTYAEKRIRAAIEVIEPLAGQLAGNFYPQDYLTDSFYHPPVEAPVERKEKLKSLMKMLYLFNSALYVVRAKATVMAALPFRPYQSDSPQ